MTLSDEQLRAAALDRDGLVTMMAREILSLRTSRSPVAEAVKSSGEVMIDDIREALAVVGYYSSAEARSPHLVFQDELLPRLRVLRDFAVTFGAAAEASPHINAWMPDDLRAAYHACRMALRVRL